MAIEVYEFRQQISKQDLSRYLRRRAELRSAVIQWLNRMPAPFFIALPHIQDAVDRYGEQVLVDAQADLRRYFAVMHMRGLTVGGLPTGLSPLEVSPRDVKPSNSAIGNLGEGIAGWYLESQDMIPLARPIGDGPDFIFTDFNRTSYALVEVKSTQEETINDRVREAISTIFDFAGKLIVGDPRTLYDCRAIGVIIKTADDYELRSLNIIVR